MAATIALVFDKSWICKDSELSIEISANLIVAPLKAKALAVDTKVYDGSIISSPGCISINAHISNAAVQECVKSMSALGDIDNFFMTCLGKWTIT